MILTTTDLGDLARWAALLTVAGGVPDDARVELHVGPHDWRLVVPGHAPYVMEPDGSHARRMP